MLSHEDRGGQALRECADGALSANMALMHLFLDAPDRRLALHKLDSAIERENGAGRDRLLRARSLWRETPDAFELIRSIVATESSSCDDDGIARCARGFDAVADLSPIAGVALYSLGREDLLQQATAEVVEDLGKEGLLAGDRCALEIGCGSGRFLAALAPRLLYVIGVDVSAHMLDHAWRRCVSHANVEVMQGDGRRFPFLPNAGFDFAIAIDSFPYLVGAGDDVARSNLEEARRIVRPGGRLIIVNYSYRGDDDRDRRDILRHAHEIGFEVRRSGARPFRLWDGAIFDLQRPNE